MGTKTKYKIHKGNLQIFDISKNSWTSRKIHKLEADTLTLELADSVLAKYTNKKYTIDQTEHYDQIIVSSSGCYGTCPIADISIHRNGNVIVLASRNNTVDGLFSAKLQKAEFSEFERNFKKAGIANLANQYIADWTDDEEISITFVRDNKIVKTITDYGMKAPTTFYWAYTPIRYIYQSLQLTPIGDKIKTSSYISILHKGKLKYELKKSEGFFLKTLLLKSKMANKQFKEEYQLQFAGESKPELVYTDGRYYRFGNTTYDIGYNFIEENNIHKD